MNLKPCKQTKGRNYNAAAYWVFLVSGICFSLAGDFTQGFTFMGLAPIFDPFDSSVPFGQRPRYQRAWLVVHVLVTFAVIGLSLFL